MAAAFPIFVPHPGSQLLKTGDSEGEVVFLSAKRWDRRTANWSKFLDSDWVVGLLGWLDAGLNKTKW